MTTERRGRPRSADVDVAVLDAAITMVADSGLDGFSMDELAERAGVAKSTIYRRWPSRAELIVDALQRGLRPLELTDTGSLRGDLRAYGDEVRDRFERGRLSDVLPHLIGGAVADPQVRSSLDAYVQFRRQPLRVIFERAIERAELPTDTDVGMLVDLVVGPILYRKLLTREPVDEQFVQRLLDAVLPA